MKKYELTNEVIEFKGRKLHRIKALRDFSNVTAGDLGGYVESEENLSHEGNAWIYNVAKVYENAIICDNATVHNSSEVFGNAWIYDNARIIGCSQVYENAIICGEAEVYNSAKVYGNAKIFENASIFMRAQVYGYAKVFGYANIEDNAQIYGYAEVRTSTISKKAKVYGYAEVYDGAQIGMNAQICEGEDYTLIKGFGKYHRTTTFFRCEDGKVRVICGCFSGTLKEFREQVERTRDGKVAKEYLMIADLMELHFTDKEDE